MAGGQKILITISRQLGSGGAYLAQQAARRLGYKYVDREILSRATEYLKESEENISSREERTSGFLENLIRVFIYGTPETAYVPPPLRLIYDTDLFETEARIIREIADKDDAVIVGRAGFHVLKDRPGLVSIFAHAPLEFRLKRVMEFYKVPNRDEAASIIKESDANRRKFVETVSGHDWTDARCYHLSINTAATGFELAGRMITDLAGEVKKRIEK